MALLLSIFLSNIVPVLLIAAAGYLLARYVALDARAISHVVFYAALPCLVFELVIQASGAPDAYGGVAFVVIGMTVVMGTLGYVVGKLAGLAGRELRAFMLVVMISNTGNFGLPVVQLAFGDAALNYAAFFFLVSSIVTYIVGPALAADSRGGVGAALANIRRIPALYGFIAALAIRAFGVPVPAPLMRSVGVLGGVALPMMLLILGAQLQRAARPPRPSIALLACLLSLVAAPVLALALTSLLHVTGPAREASVLLASMPSAVMTIIFSMEYDLAPQFVTSTVFLATLASPFTVTLVIAYLRS